MPLAPDTHLGRYKIRAEIGAGGMRHVVAAMQCEGPDSFRIDLP